MPPNDISIFEANTLQADNAWVTTCELPRIVNGELPEWVHICPIGGWHDMRNNRPVELTAELMQRLISRFNDYGTDFYIDWQHRSLKPTTVDNKNDSDAAFWCDRMELRDDGIWGGVSLWTHAGARDVASGAFRYLSPVILWNSPHRKTGKRGPELLNAALTNDPLLVGIKPLVADALAGMTARNQTTPDERSNRMNEFIRKWLEARGVPLAADVGEDKLQEALKAEMDKLTNAEAFVAHVRKKLTPDSKEALTADAFDKALDSKNKALPKDLAAAFGDDAITVAAASAKVLGWKNEEAKGENGNTPTIDANAIAADVKQQIKDEDLLEAAVKDGRIAPAMKDSYEKTLFSADAAVRAAARKQIENLKPSGILAADINLGGDPPPLIVDAMQAQADKDVAEALDMTVAEINEKEGSEVEDG